MKTPKPKSKPINLKKAKTAPLAKRSNLETIREFARAAEAPGSFLEFYESMPDVLAARDLKALVRDVAAARKDGRHVVLGVGAHVIKCGLSPMIIDLIERGVITALAMNGAGAIHDFEISLIGETSEDVAEGLEDGTYGMARETGEAMCKAAVEGAKGIGYGRALGEMILRKKNKFARYSLLATCAKHDIPATVHVAIGTDIVHMHPCANGAAIGEASMIDFKKFAGVVADLDKGVYINMGSAVLLPEVFMKAVNVARNIHGRPKNVTTANFDMIRHYRPAVNVLGRPAKKSYSITGHHEIMFPLFYHGLLLTI
jgi:hypothetical protein